MGSLVDQAMIKLIFTSIIYFGLDLILDLAEVYYRTGTKAQLLIFFYRQLADTESNNLKWCVSRKI